MSALQKAKELLKRLRGDTDSPGKVLHDLRSAGHSVEADGTNLVIKPRVTPELANRIRQHKDGILDAIGASRTEDFDFWDSAAVEEITSIILAKLELYDWPRSEETSRQLVKLQDEFDLACHDSNMIAFKRIASKIMTFLDSEPVKIGSTGYHYQQDGFAWVLWAKLKTGSQKWVCVCPGLEDREAIGAFDKIVREKTKLQTKVLACGEVP